MDLSSRVEPLPAGRWQQGGRALFRVMLSGIFWVAGIQHLLHPEAVTRRLLEAPLSGLATWMASPDVLVGAAGLGLLVGGLALLVGFRTRWAALWLILLLVPITLTVQVGRLSTLGPLFKNIGLAGGLVFFLTHGAEALSLDSLLGRRAARRLGAGAGAVELTGGST